MLYHTLSEVQNDPSILKKYWHEKYIPCICGRCGTGHLKTKNIVYACVKNTKQEHFFCTKKCAGLRQRDSIGAGRICRECAKYTPVKKLHHRQGWVCNTCAAKHPKLRYRSYKARAVAVGILFDLTYEQFMVHWQVPCTYCEEPMETIGLDRVDNNKGYEPENVVSCCKFCNALKLEGTLDEFYARCVRIANTHRVQP